MTKYKTDKKISYAGIIMALPFAILLIINPPEEQVTLIGISALILVVSIAPVLLNKNRYLEITEQGITEYCGRKSWSYKWHEIKDFEIVDYAETKSIGFQIIEKGKKNFLSKLIYGNKDQYIHNQYPENLETIILVINS